VQTMTHPGPTLDELCRAATPAALDEFVRRCLAPRAGRGMRRAAAVAARVRRERLGA
jgi:hypothetical protein